MDEQEWNRWVKIAFRHLYQTQSDFRTFADRNSHLGPALLGDDRPAPNGDEFETEMLRVLSR